MNNLYSKELPQDIQKWLLQFSEFVRYRQFKLAKNLFSKDIQSFGTRCFYADGLEQLLYEQWQPIWNTTQNFEFDFNQTQFKKVDDTVIVLTTWKSIGMDEKKSHFIRRGRASLILQKIDRDWKCIHTHFSMI